MPCIIRKVRGEAVALAVPLLLGNMLQQLYHTVDSLIVGRFLGMEAFAAVGIAGTVMHLFLFMVNGFCVGGSVLFAQLYGMGDQAAFRREVFVAVSFGSLLTVLAQLLSAGICVPLFLEAGEPLSVRYGTGYLRLIAVFYVLCFIGNVFVGYFRGIGRVSVPIVGTTLQITLRVILSYALIGPMGLEAVALATGLGWAAVVSYQILTIKRQGTVLKNAIIFSSKIVGNT